MAQLKRDYYDAPRRPQGRLRRRAIKKAFRALARELHPDVSDDPDAEERFREIAEAYEVLSSRRRGSSTTATATRACGRAASAPTDFDFGGLSDLLGAFFGDDLFGGMASGAAQRRGGDVVAEVADRAVRGRARSDPRGVVHGRRALRRPAAGAAPTREPSLDDLLPVRTAPAGSSRSARRCSDSS